MQRDCSAEGQRCNCCLYRHRLPSCYSGIQTVSIVGGYRPTVLPDEMFRFGAGSRPDSMRRTVVERALPGLP